jgi:hypothetical protein
MEVSLISILGVCGGIIVLSLFVLEQMDKLSNKSLWYDGLNTVGSALLLLYAFDHHVWPFVATNSVWFAFSFRDTLYSVRRRYVPIREKAEGP